MINSCTRVLIEDKNFPVNFTFKTNYFNDY